MVLLNKVKRTISSLGFLAIYIYVYYSSKSKASNPDVQATMADHGKSLGVVEKTLFFFERFALLVALLIPEAKDLALLCVLIANLVYFTVCCITMDDHVASLFPFVVSTCMLYSLHVSKVTLIILYSWCNFITFY